MIAINDLAKIREDVMDQFVEQWHSPKEHWKHSDECERNLNRLAEMLEQLRLFDYLVDLRLSLSQIAFLNDMSKKELKEAILFDGNGIGLDPEDLEDRSRVRRHLDLVDLRLSLAQTASLNESAQEIDIVKKYFENDLA